MTGNFAAGWRQVAAGFVLLGCMSMIGSSYGTIAVPLAAEFGPSRFVLMLAMTVTSLVSGLISPVLGSLMDRVSLRKIILAGAGFMVAGYLALSFAPSFNAVLAIFALLIAPANVLMGMMSISVLMSRWFVAQRGRAIGFAIAGVSAGTAAFAPLIQALLDTWEWREALRVLAAILAVLTIPAALLIVNHPADKGLNPDGAASPPEAAAATSGTTPVQISALKIVTDPSFWMLAALVATVSSAMKGMVTNLAPLAIDEGIKASDAAYLVTIFAGCGFVAKLIFAAIADRFPPKVLLFIILSGCACAMIALTRAEAGYATIAAGVALLGIFGGFVVPMQSFLVPRIFGVEVVGKALGLMNLALLAVLMTVPPLFGWTFDKTGNYDLIFLIFAVLAVLVMLAVPWLRLHPRQPAAPVLVPA